FKNRVNKQAFGQTIFPDIVYRAVARISGLTPTKFGVETTIKAWLRNSPA
ncbi:unnamed protein product, partial [Allacma fusca]